MPSPPSGAEGLEWLPPATPPVRGADDAREVLDMCALRWRTGDWRRILKTGRETGKSGFHAAGRMKAAVAINAVIAWRLAAPARETPPPTLSEIAILPDCAVARCLPVPGRERPENPVDLEAIRTAGRF